MGSSQPIGLIRITCNVHVILLNKEIIITKRLDTMRYFKGQTLNYIPKDKFDEKEMKGRQMFWGIISGSNKLICVEFTEDKFNPIDCFMTGTTGISCFELKRRNILSSKYPNCILEKKKYDALMNACEQSGYTPYYVVMYTDTAYLWSLKNLDITNRVQKMRCTQTTTENYQKGQVEKEVILLDLKEGKKIRIKEIKN